MPAQYSMMAPATTQIHRASGCGPPATNRNAALTSAMTVNTLGSRTNWAQTWKRDGVLGSVLEEDDKFELS